MPPLDNTDISAAIDELGEGFNQFKSGIDNRLGKLEARLSRPSLGGGSTDLATDADRKAFNVGIRNFLKSNDQAEIKAMSVGSDPDGGFVVLPQVAPQILARIHEMSPIRSVARVISLTSDAWEEPQEEGDVEATWVGETSGRPETEASKLRKLRIPAEEIYAAPRITQKLLDDANYDLAGFLSERIGNRFGRSEASAFVSGNGVNKPRGFTTYPTAATGDDTRPWGTLEHVNTGGAGGFAGSNPADVFFDVQATLKTGYRARAVWVMNRRTFAQMRKLKTANGNYLIDYIPALGVQEQWSDGTSGMQLLGHRIVLAEDMPDIGAGSLSIAFGDFSRGYTIVDRIGMRLLSDPYSEKPFVIMYAYRRVGGDVSDFEAIKFLRFAAS